MYIRHSLGSVSLWGSDLRSGPGSKAPNSFKNRRPIATVISNDRTDAGAMVKFGVDFVIIRGMFLLGNRKIC